LVGLFNWKKVCHGSSASPANYETTFNRILTQRPDLFIATDLGKAKVALGCGIPTALVTPKLTKLYSSTNFSTGSSDCAHVGLSLGPADASGYQKYPDCAHVGLNLAFDYDNCQVDDRSDIDWKLLQNENSRNRLHKYWNQEYANRHIVQKEGNLLPFILKLVQLRRLLPNNVEIYLITARNRKACFRVMNTLDAFGIDFDKMTFGLSNKADALLAIKKPIHMFFDDQRSTVDKVASVFPAARVPGGVTNISAEKSSQ
jgi:hypothetical protein